MTRNTGPSDSMARIPETRASLLVRVRDADDREAWYEFVEIYRPVIVRLARARGMQEADAEDLAQQVLIALAGAVERWDGSGSARFRTWLRRVAENAILNALTRGRPDRGSGHPDVRDLLSQVPARKEADSELLRLEYRREVFRWGARRIRDEFHESTWRAFWQTAIENRSVEEVAAELGKSKGVVYAARSRVMRRLKTVIEEFEGAGQEADDE